MDALRRSQLLERSGQRCPRLVHDRAGLLGTRRQLRLQQTEGHRDRDEPLLRPVVQIALDPAPLRIRHLNQTCPRRLQLHQPRAQAASAARSPESGRRRRRPSRPAPRCARVLGHRCCRRRDRFAVALDQRGQAMVSGSFRGARRVRPRRRRSPARPETNRRPRVRDRERAGERLAQIDAGARLAQRHDEPSDSTTGERALEDDDEDRDRHGRRHVGAARWRAGRQRIGDRSSVAVTAGHERRTRRWRGRHSTAAGRAGPTSDDEHDHDREISASPATLEIEQVRARGSC